MIDANTGMHVILYVALTLGFGRLCWVRGYKAGDANYKHMGKNL